MAKLIIDQKDYGVQAFVVQLRSLENHRLLNGIETGDIGKKFGFEAYDNGYVKFSQHRIPRFNMLMRYAYLDENGRFEKKGRVVKGCSKNFGQLSINYKISNFCFLFRKKK
jgi:acyl-CoA oxidase